MQDIPGPGQYDSPKVAIKQSFSKGIDSIFASTIDRDLIKYVGTELIR
jgi:hypothetical protein